jgi:hypothetical protein
MSPINHPDDRRRSVAVFNNRPTLVESSHQTGKPRDKIPGDGYASRLGSGFASSSSSASEFAVFLCCVFRCSALGFRLVHCVADRRVFLFLLARGEGKSCDSFFFGYFA